MIITSELREYAHDCCARVDDAIHAIADRIDAEHESAIQQVLIGEGSVPATDENMAEHGWVRLPVDADGEPWHRGDRVIDPKDPDGKVNTVWIAGDNTLITDDHLLIFPANELRHYHDPTVEDVSREFANEVYADADNEIRDRDYLCAKYAKRLTLAEGEDA